MHRTGSLRLCSTFGLLSCAGSTRLLEPEVEEYFRPEPGALPPFEAPRIHKPTRQQFNDLILDGKIFVVPDLSADWELRHWDCDFFQTDPEFKKAAMNHQYTAGGAREAKLGDDWQGDKTASGAKNDTAPQIAPFYWGIKDVQFEDRPGWTKAMLRRVAKSFKVPDFMHPERTARDFGATPEFWFGTGKAGAKAHMDSHVQATVSVQISGRKRWRLMPLRQRDAPFLAMIYSDGQPYENDEGWQPLFEIVLEPGEGLFFPPGMIHETMNVGDVCASSVTFQFNYPYAARFYRRFFPRVRYTADIGESWADKLEESHCARVGIACRTLPGASVHTCGQRRIMVCVRRRLGVFQQSLAGCVPAPTEPFRLEEAVDGAVNEHCNHRLLIWEFSG